jgi:RNA polymerase-binding transcription factor DksA
MKPEDLSLFEKLVIEKMSHILYQRHHVSTVEEKSKVVEACSMFDDADLNELSFALRRIEKGTYGQCVICRHDIPSDVLMKNLTARLCPSCESVINEKNTSSSTSKK